MSTTAKGIFLGSCIFSVAIIYKVHDYQDKERKRVREGVYKDIERRNLKESESLTEQKIEQKIHNIQMLNNQAKLQESLSSQSPK